MSGVAQSLTQRPGVARIAIGTHTGARVSEHFGYATRFEIWEISPSGSRLVETRINRPACGADMNDRAAEMMDASVATVADCRAVVVAQLGECALTRLTKLGILAFETEDTIGETLRQLAEYEALYSEVRQ
jgi:predicted Fe-Mo cluster-binding NifX family protein